MSEVWLDRPEFAPWTFVAGELAPLVNDAARDDEALRELLSGWMILTRFRPELDEDGLWSRIDRAVRDLDEAELLDALPRLVGLGELVNEWKRFAARRAPRGADVADQEREALRLFRRTDTVRLMLLGVWRLPLPEERRHEAATLRDAVDREVVRPLLAAPPREIAPWVAHLLTGFRDDLTDVDPDLARTLDVWHATAT